jgi:multidrug transporter EmrE-like cation transporter
MSPNIIYYVIILTMTKLIGWFVIQNIILKKYNRENIYWLSAMFTLLPFILLTAMRTESMVVLNNFWYALSIALTTLMGIVYFGEIVSNYDKFATLLITIALGLFVLNTINKK